MNVAQATNLCPGTPATACESFTATQLAGALGIKRQVVQRMLSQIAPADPVRVAGNEARAWTLESLPAAMRAELKKRTDCAGCRTERDYILAPQSTWKPRIQLTEIAPHCVAAAARLQRALRRALEIQTDASAARGEAVKVGLEDYAREFGHPVSERYLRKLLERTVERDGGAHIWERLEIYLPDRPARKSVPRPVAPLAALSEFRELEDVVATFKNRAEPRAAGGIVERTGWRLL